MIKSFKKTALIVGLCALAVLCLGIGIVVLSKPTSTFATSETHNHTSFASWGDKEEEKGTLPETEGSYVLTDDIMIDKTWTVPTGTVNICLNGYSIIMTEECDVISVPKNAELNIYDCNATKWNYLGVDGVGGKICVYRGKNKGITVMGTLNMYSGTVFGVKTGVYVLNGNFNMYGGAVTANIYQSEETDIFGAGVLVDGGLFTMNGGGIYGNSLRANGYGVELYSFGAGVCVNNEGVFTMNGGEIYGNESHYGSGIYVKNGTFTMTDGEIHDNGGESSIYGAGLYVDGSGTAVLTGGRIYNNTIHNNVGGAGVYNKGTLSLGGTIKIANNRHDYDVGGVSNLCFDNSGDNKVIELISPESGMLVGISMMNKTSFTDSVEQGTERYFFADNEDEYVAYNGYKVILKDIRSFEDIYKIDIKCSEHGVVYASVQGVEEELVDATIVYLTVVPENGYALKSLKYNGNDITGVKSFAMINEDVTVTAEFATCVNHVDEDGDNSCDICGELIKVMAQVEKCNIAFEDNVYLLFAVKTYKTDSEPKLYLWSEGDGEYEISDGDCKEIELWEKDYDIGGEKYFVFIYKELSAKQMTDNVYVKPYVDGFYGDLVRYSILDYAYNQIKKNTNPELVELLSAMLDYGTASQKYFKVDDGNGGKISYNANRLANAKYFEIDVAGARLPDGTSYGLFAENEEITLIAGDKEDCKFTRWESDGLGTLGSEKSLVYTVAASDSVRAVYEKTHCTVKVSVVDGENGSLKYDGKEFTEKEFTSVLIGSEIKIEEDKITIGNYEVVGEFDDGYLLLAVVEDGLTKVSKDLTIHVSFIKKVTLNWGEAKINNGIVNYQSEDGTTSSLITGNTKSWIKEESFDTPVWYGIDNGDGVFENGSRFWVKWIQQSSSEFDDLKNQIDIIGGEVEMFLTVGLINPSGDEYQDLNDKVDFYIELGDDWDKENYKLFTIDDESEEVQVVKKILLGPDGIEREYAVLSLNGKSKFAVLNLNHF